MKIIFLDIDGVLNTGWTTRDSRLEPVLIERLNNIIKETDAKIVVSSAWRRYDPNLNITLGQFRWEGFTGEFYDKIEFLNYTVRGVEIQKWLDDTSDDVSDFVILDDLPMTAFLGLWDHVYQTKMDSGLTEEIMEEIIERFNK